MHLKRIFWPWGVIVDLEAEIEAAHEALDTLEEGMGSLFNDAKNVISNAARDFAVLGDALMTIDETISAVKSPNGTSKKVQRIAQEALGNTMAAVTDEVRVAIRALLEAEAAAVVEVGEEVEEA